MSSSLSQVVLEPSYPNWQRSNDGDLALFWTKTTEIGALIRTKPGGFEIHYYTNESAVDTWNTAMTHVATMEEAQRIAEVIMKFIKLGKEK